MPVTARLLQRLRETLGDEATNDLFAWVEDAGWVNRAAVREIADLYFERFEARLGEAVARLDARLEQGLAQVRAEVRQEVARLEQGLAAVRAEVRADLATQRADLVKWMFMFWLGTILPLAGLMVALLRL
jgi:hypothetical protein